jgi:hypothetical protein
MRIERLAIVGIGLTVAGLLLVVGFWPLTSLSGARLLAAKSGNQYPGYSPGDRITIRERILNVSYANFAGSPTTFLELDDGNPDVATTILVSGDARGVVSPGDVIFTSAVLRSVNFGFTFQYWGVESPADIHQSWPVDAVFYGITAAGVVVLVVAAFRKP